MMKQEKIGGIDRYEVESDLRALRNVEKIKGSSKRLSAVKTLVKEEMGALEKIAGHDKSGLGNGMDYAGSMKKKSHNSKMSY